MVREYDSLWTIGDQVSITFPGNGLLKNATVIKVAFDNLNTLYDVEVPYNYYSFENIEMRGIARLHGLKEWHLRDPESPISDIQ